jgi:hypothetical protein
MKRTQHVGSAPAATLPGQLEQIISAPLVRTRYGSIDQVRTYGSVFTAYYDRLMIGRLPVHCVDATKLIMLTCALSLSKG